MGYNAGLNIAGIGINPPIDDPTGIASLKGVNDNDFIQRKSGLWVNRSIAQVRADLNSQETISSNADFSLLVGTNAERILYTGAQSANRSVTLSSLNAARGAKFHITHSGTGGFLLNIGTGPLKALRSGQWAEFVFDGTNWYLSNFGVLDVAPAMEFVQSVTLNGSQYLDITTGFAAGYDQYIFNISKLYATTSGQLDFVLSDNSGSSWFTSNYHGYSYMQAGTAGGYSAVIPYYNYNTSRFVLHPNVQGNQNGARSAVLRLSRPSGFVPFYEGAFNDTFGSPIIGDLLSYWATALTAFVPNAIRFSVSAGSYAFYAKIDMFRVKTS